MKYKLVLYNFDNALRVATSTTEK